MADKYLSDEEVFGPGAGAGSGYVSDDEVFGPPKNRSYLGAALESGVRTLGAAGATVLDAINPFTTSEEDAAKLYKDDPEGFKRFQEESAAAVLQRFAAEQTKRSREVMQEVSPDETGAVSGAPLGELEYATLDPEKAAYLSPTRVAGDVLQSLPSTLALAISGYFTRGKALQAYEQALARETAKGVTKAEAQAIAKAEAVREGAKSMAVISGSSEGVVTGAQQYNQALDQVGELDQAKIEQSPEYQALLDEGYAPETARATLANRVATQSGVTSGVTTGLISAAGGRYLGGLVGEGGSLLPRVGKGFLIEGATEAPQSTLEQINQNVAMRRIDPSQDILEGAGEAAAAGFVVGGVTGGAFGAAFGGGDASRQRQRVAEQDLREAPDAASAAAAANELAGSVDELTSAIDEYLTPTGEIPTPEQAAATPAPQDTALREDPTRSMIDRQAGLIAQAQAAGTQFDRQMALDQAQAALPQPEEGRAAGFVDLTPMNEMQAQQRLAVLRDQTAQAGGNALGLAIVPHPAQADRFAIVEQALPDLSLPQAETTIAPDQAQFQIESAALGGQVNQARAEDSATRGPVIDQALKAVEARGGVASPAEARIFQEAGIGQPYDRVDPALGPEPAPLIEIAGAARESFTPNQQIAAQEVQADQAARRESDIAQRDRTTEQQIAAAGQARQAPDAGAVISALVTPGAQRSAEQVRVVNEARNRFSPADFSILERAATAPFQLNTEERMRLRELRNPSVSETNTNVSETSTGLMGTRVAERLGQPSGGRIVTTNAKLSSQRVAPGGTVTINDGETQHEARVVENGRLGVQGRLLQQIARLFNKRLVTFESDTLQADGFVMDGDNDSIYINAQSQMSVLAVFGHELTHLLKRDNPEAYAALEAVVQREMRDGSMAQFEQEYGEGANLEEMTSDLVGNRFQEADFWQSVFDEIAAQNPEGARGIIARVAAAINRAINAFLKVIRQPGFQADQYVNDINAVKRAVNQAMTAYMQQPRQATTQVTTEVTPEVTPAVQPSMAERLREAARGARQEMGETITASPARRQQARVMFEVAPDPDNTALKEQWDALPAERKAEISQRVAARVMPRVFDILGIKRTRVLDQMGGYLEDTNPSFAAVFTSTTEAADVLEAAKVTGFALHQQSMMVLSGEPFAGSFETGLITVTLPEGKTDQESVHQVYRQLRALNPDAVQGHTTVEREMVLAVPNNVLASLTQQVENALSAEYSVRKAVGHMAFPEKKDYDYASQKRTGRSAELLARRPEILRLREETDAAIQDELATYEVETQGAPGRQVGTPRSTVDLMTINPVRARAALGLKPNPVSGDGNGVRQIGEALNNATLNQHGRISDTDTSPEAQDMLAQAMADEVQYQLRTTSETGSGLGWYSNNYPRAVKKLARVFPELKTSKAARAMFTAAVAITSNGEKVSLNINNAIRLYKNYRETGSFLGANVGSRRAAALDANVIALDRLVQEMGPLAAARHLMGEMTVGQINAELRKRGEKPDSSYTATTVMPRAALYFGPKLGAFYANLMGSEGYLTMDLWWSRTINRMRGVLVPRATDSSIDNLRDLLGQPDLSRDQVVSASIGPRNAYEGRNFQTELEQLVGEKEPNTNAGSERWMAKARAAAGARFDEMLRQQRIEKTANTIYKNEFEGLEEAPFRASDRAFMYGAARRAQEILEQRLGQKLSIADIQAALWYYEKRLYAKLSGRKADDIGYEEAILQHAESDRPERSSARFDRESDGGNDAGREGRVLDRPGQEDRPAGEVVSTDPSAGDQNLQFSRRRKPPPKKTVKAYKLFRVDARKPGQLFPLFVNANDPVEIDVWLDADEGPLTEKGKVKSKIGDLAYRPGWHAGDVPIATHIGGKSDPTFTAPDVRPDNHVWAEVEMAADRDWQKEADKRGTNAQGRLVAGKAHITDQIPANGFYRYKTNPNMTGNWLIGGSMKVNRILSDTEVKRINDKAGVTDLPREAPFDAEKFGFGKTKLSRRRNPQVDTPEFQRWFGDSKVVDKNGDPLVVYHGTAYDFSEFSPERLGSNTGAASARAGFFFTARPKTAEYYAKGQFPNLESAAKAKRQIAYVYDTPTGEYQEGARVIDIKFSEEGTTPNIMPVYLSLQNPLTYDFKNKVYRDKKYWELIDQAKKEGRDGVILKNTYDSGEYSRFDAIIRGRFKGEDIYIIFEPTQIKSAIGNIGTFDPTKTDITLSRQRTGPFYSQLAKAIDEVPARLETQPAQQWKAWLASNASKLGIKKDEIEWTGINEYLDLRGKEKVTKAELVDYLDENTVEVGDVMFSEAEARFTEKDITNEYYSDEGIVTPDGDSASRVVEFNIADGDFPTTFTAFELYDEYESRGWELFIEDVLVFIADDLTGIRDHVRENAEDGGAVGANAARFGEFQLPGGENYRELLVRVPDAVMKARDIAEYRVPQPHRYGKREADYNRLAHVRFNDRVDADGNKVLFVEEIQSDWAQEGRKKGFAETKPKYLKGKASASLEPAGLWQVEWEDGTISSGLYKNRAEQLASEGKLVKPSGVSKAPFVQDTKAWVGLTVKRMLAYAAENGYDKVAFIDGQQSADRYDLSKRVDRVSYFPDSKTVAAYKDDQIVVEEKVSEQKPLDEIIGKDAASKILEQPAEDVVNARGDKVQSLSGVELKVGGQGMIKFYDQIVPQIVNDVLKKVGGGKLEQIDVRGRERGGISGNDIMQGMGIPEADRAEYWRNLTDKERDDLTENARNVSLVQPGFTITPEMRAKVAEGLPLFSRRRNYGSLTAAQEQALRNVGGIVPEQTAGDRMKELGGKFQRSWFSGIFDQFAPLKDVDQRAYMLARLSKGSDGALEALMLYGKPFMNGDVPDVNVNDQGFINVMATLKGEHDRFLWWVAAQRAENIKANAQKAQARIATIDANLAQLRQAKKAATAAVDYRKIEQDISTLEAERSRLKNTGQENLFTDQDISSLKSLNQGNFEDGTPRGQAYANALVKMNEFNDAVLNIAEQSGLIDGQARQLFKDMPYVPFYRVMEDGVDGPSFSSGLVNQQAWKKLKGGTQKLNEDLLSNVLLNWAHLFDAAGKNRAGVASLQAATQIGIAQKVPAGTKGAVKVMEQGQTQHYTIDDPYIMEAVTALNYQPPGFFAPFSTFKKWLTIGVTASPTFKIKNLMRDSLQAIGTAPMSYNVASNVMKGFKQGSQETQTFASMLAGGGLIRFGSMIEGTNRTNYMIERQGGILLNEGGWKKLQRQMTGLVEAYAELGDRLENVNRVSLYEHLISKGYSQAEANFMSRDLMDFSLQGRWPVVRFLAQSVPFLNARLQGLSKLGRGAKDDPRRFGYVVGAVAMASIALMLAYEDDEDWKKRSDWDRDSNWWFKIGDTAFRIPKPFEIGAIGTVAERTWEVAFNDDMSWKRYRQRLSHMIFETFAMDPTPQLVVPISEIYANKEGFTQRPIEGLGLQKLRPEDRATERTSSVARLLGQMGLPSPVSLVKGDYEKLSPVQIDHLIRGYFGWIGTTATTILDFGLRPFMDRGERPAYRLKDVFVAGNFAEGLPANSSRYVDQLYEQSRIIEQAYMSYRDAKKKGDREKVRELLADEGDKIKAYKSINKISQQVSDINRKIRQIESSKTLSADTKRKMIDKLSERKDKVAKRAQKFAKID